MPACASRASGPGDGGTTAQAARPSRTAAGPSPTGGTPPWGRAAERERWRGGGAVAWEPGRHGPYARAKRSSRPDCFAKWTAAGVSIDDAPPANARRISMRCAPRVALSRAVCGGSATARTSFSPRSNLTVRRFIEATRGVPGNAISFPMPHIAGRRPSPDLGDDFRPPPRGPACPRCSSSARWMAGHRRPKRGRSSRGSAQAPVDGGGDRR